MKPDQIKRAHDLLTARVEITGFLLRCYTTEDGYLKHPNRDDQKRYDGARVGVIGLCEERVYSAFPEEDHDCLLLVSHLPLDVLADALGRHLIQIEMELRALGVDPEEIVFRDEQPEPATAGVAVSNEEQTTNGTSE